jgi:hypothetical protein
MSRCVQIAVHFEVIMGDYSSILFARPSFAEGAARILDFGGTLTEFNRSPSGEAADGHALWADWMTIGRDIESAINQQHGIQATKKQAS